MTDATLTQPTTRTVAVPGATVTYDVRPADGTTTEPPLMLIGSPMGAGGFATLGTHFPDRTVLTYDPRGVERSTKDDPSTESTPEQHADDIHRGDRGGRRRAGRPLREQRRRGQRAGTRRPPPRRRPGPRRPRAAARGAHLRPRRRLRRDRGHPRHLPARRLWPGDGEVHHPRQQQGRCRRRTSRASRSRSRDVRPADAGRRLAERPPAPPEHHHLHALRARLRRAPGGTHDDRDRGRRGVGGPAGPSRRRGRGPAPRPVAGHLPGWPRRLPRRRVRPDRQARRVRREAPRGPRARTPDDRSARPVSGGRA